MRFLTLSVLPVLALAAKDSISAKVTTPKAKEQAISKASFQNVNSTLDFYASSCKTCPYAICNNKYIPEGNSNVTLSCWTEGDQVGDTKLWLKTTDNCYLNEYDLLEYKGELRKDLKYCGKVPVDITKEKAKIRYLSVCKWGRSTSSENRAYYDRDQSVTLTCYGKGQKLINNDWWYKTIDNCHISGSEIWGKPNHDDLYPCGPASPNRIDENDPKPPKTTTSKAPTQTPAPGKPKREEGKLNSFARRWLQEGKIGEEYAPCFSCPSGRKNASDCAVVKTYEYNQTTLSQCYTRRYETLPNGTETSEAWMLTQDWCYTSTDNFWEPPYDHYYYPSCSYWPRWA